MEIKAILDRVESDTQVAVEGLEERLQELEARQQVLESSPPAAPLAADSDPAFVLNTTTGRLHRVGVSLRLPMAAWNTACGRWYFGSTKAGVRLLHAEAHADVRSRCGGCGL